MVPAGDVRDYHTLPAELVVPGAPSVKFLQGGLDVCAAASMASVLSFIGQQLHAKSLFMAFTNDTTARGTHPEIINRVRDKVGTCLTTGSGKCGSLIKTLKCWNRPSRQSGTRTRLLKIAALCCGCCVHQIIQHPIVWGGRSVDI